MKDFQPEAFQKLFTVRERERMGAVNKIFSYRVGRAIFIG
jgi:hypothetical protein